VLPDNAGGANMGTLAADHQRMLGDGMCTRRPLSNPPSIRDFVAGREELGNARILPT
jgi:hypothetical protein